MTERLDYARRLARVESAKAEKRNDLTSAQNHSEVNPRKETAEKFGVGINELSRRKQILEHKAEISPSDFANWDDGSGLFIIESYE